MQEAELALKRGKSVEILLGRCGDTLRPGIRFAVLHGAQTGIRLSVHEMLDSGNADFLDLYETWPLDKDGDPDGCVLELEMGNATDCLDRLKQRFPGQTYRMVNFPLWADEYLDLLLDRSAESSDV